MPRAAAFIARALASDAAAAAMAPQVAAPRAAHDRLQSAR
jgi:hypothetical protein